MYRATLQVTAALLLAGAIAYVHPLAAADEAKDAPKAAEPAKPADSAPAAPAAAAPAAAPAAASGDAAAAALPPWPGGSPVPFVKGVSGTPESAADIKANPMKPLERVVKSPKGSLKNPYTDDPVAIAEGKKLFFGKSCNGCHGGGGGGGMCPPLTNTVWVYGDDDDTLFRLISLGSQELQKAGYTRRGGEGVVGPMPPFGELIDKDQDVFKIIAWIRTLFSGGPERRHW